MYRCQVLTQWLQFHIDSPHLPLEGILVLGEVEVIRPIPLPTPPIPELKVKVAVLCSEMDLTPPPIIKGVGVSQNAAEFGEVLGRLGRGRGGGREGEGKRRGGGRGRIGV